MDLSRFIPIRSLSRRFSAGRRRARGRGERNDDFDMITRSPPVCIDKRIFRRDTKLITICLMDCAEHAPGYLFARGFRRACIFFRPDLFSLFYRDLYSRSFLSLCLSLCLSLSCLFFSVFQLSVGLSLGYLPFLFPRFSFSLLSFAVAGTELLYIFLDVYSSFTYFGGIWSKTGNIGEKRRKSRVYCSCNIRDSNFRVGECLPLD